MKKNKLILAMYIGVIALAVSSVSMSVAWYAASRTLYVNSIEIYVDADRELDISLSKDEGYVEHIEHTELEASGVFMPVTTAHSSEWLSKDNIDMPIFYDETRSYEEENIKLFSEMDRGYFSRKFYIKSDDDVYVTVDPEKTFIKPNTEYNSSYAEYLFDKYQSRNDEYYKDYSVAELKEMLDHVVEAMRFSLLVKVGEEYKYAIIDPHYNNEITYLGGLLDNDVDRYYDYYIKQNTVDDYYERVYGEIIGDKSLYVYDEGLDSDSAFLDSNTAPNAFNARHKKGIKRFNLEKSIEKGLEIKKEEAFDLKDFAKVNKPFNFPVYADTPKEIVISIYIEGWDKESVNYTMGAAFISDLTFKIDREM